MTDPIDPALLDRLSRAAARMLAAPDPVGGAVAAAVQRHNPDLDAAFADAPSSAAGRATTAGPRDNPLLDDVFGAAAEPVRRVVERHAAPVAPPTPEVYGFAPDRPPAPETTAETDTYRFAPGDEPPPPRPASSDPAPIDRFRGGPPRPAGTPATDDPFDPQPPAPARDDGRPDGVTKLLEKINDNVAKLVERAVSGQDGPPNPGGPQPPEKAGRYGWRQALDPVISPLKDSAPGRLVGRVGGGLKKRLAPAWKAVRGNRSRGRATTAPGVPAASIPGPVATEGAAGGAASAGAGAGAAAGAGMAAKAVPYVGAAVAATEALVKLAKAGVSLAYEQEGYARRLAEFSPSQAANLAQLDASRTIREMNKGENTAGSAGALMESIDRFEEAVKPFEEVGANLTNMAGAFAVNLTAFAVEYVKPIADAGKFIYEMMKPIYKWFVDKEFEDGAAADDDPVLFGDFLDRIARDEAARAAAGGRAMDAARRAHR